MTEQTGAPTGAPDNQQPSSFTQADVDRIVAERLGRERGKFADYDALKSKAVEFDKLAEARKTEAEKTTERLTAAEQKAATAELSSLRLDVALDKAPEGMPIAQVRKLARRLTGGTREELEADADELFGDFKPTAGTSERRPVESLKPGALPAGDTTAGDPNEWMRRRASRT